MRLHRGELVRRSERLISHGNAPRRLIMDETLRPTFSKWVRLPEEGRDVSAQISFPLLLLLLLRATYQVQMWRESGSPNSTLAPDPYIARMRGDPPLRRVYAPVPSRTTFLLSRNSSAVAQSLSASIWAPSPPRTYVPASLKPRWSFYPRLRASQLAPAALWSLPHTPF